MCFHFSFRQPHAHVGSPSERDTKTSDMNPELIFKSAVAFVHHRLLQCIPIMLKCCTFALKPKLAQATHMVPVQIYTHYNNWALIHWCIVRTPSWINCIIDRGSRGVTNVMDDYERFIRACLCISHFFIYCVRQLFYRS